EATAAAICPNAAESAAPEPFANPVILNPPAARLASSGPSRFAVGPVALVTVKSVDVSVVMPLPPDGVAQSAAMPDVAMGTWPTVGVPVMITPSTPATFRFVDGPVGSVTVTVESVEVMVEIVPDPVVDLRKPLIASPSYCAPSDRTGRRRIARSTNQRHAGGVALFVTVGTASPRPPARAENITVVSASGTAIFNAARMMTPMTETRAMKNA